MGWSSQETVSSRRDGPKGTYEAENASQEGRLCLCPMGGQPPDLRKRNRTSRGAASKEPDGKQRMECGAYMKRLRTVGEEARSLYRVVARLFKPDAPTAGPQGLEVGPSDKE